MLQLDEFSLRQITIKLILRITAHRVFNHVFTTDCICLTATTQYYLCDKGLEVT